MHEATERARNDAVGWLIFRKRMAQAVADFRAVACPHLPRAKEDDEGAR
jgi:hypothetical protein